MQNLRADTLSSIKWSGIGQIIRQFLQFIISVFLARILDPHDFGLLGMVVVFTGFAQMFNEMGLGSAVVQKQDIDDQQLSSVFWLNIMAGIALALLFLLISPFIAGFYREPKLKLCVALMSLNFIFVSLNIVQQSLMHKKLYFKQIASIEIIGMLVSGAVAIFLALNGYGVFSLVFQVLINSLVCAVMFWLLSDWRPKTFFSFGKIKALWNFSMNLLGFNIINYWVRNLDNLLVGKFIGSLAMGIYTRAYSLMLMPLNQISSVLSRVMFPSLSLIQHDIERVKRIYLRSCRCIALITFPLMVGLLVVAKPFILVVYGDKWQEVIPLLRIFCLVGMGQSVGTTVGWIYNSQGRTDIQFKWGIFSGVVYVVSFIIGLRWGIIGVALCYGLAGYIILWYPAWSMPGRLINLRFAEMLRNLSGPFFTSITMGIMIWIVGIFFLRDCNDGTCLLVQIPTGAIIYFSLIHFFRLKAYEELRALAGERLVKIS